MNLTDEQVIMALESCTNEDLECKDCPSHDLCDNNTFEMLRCILDLINRKQAVNELQAKEIVELKIKVEQQKAEIERLREENKSIRYCYEQAKSYNNTLAESCEKNCKKFNMTTRAEAIKEFAERLIHEIVNRLSEIQSTSVEYLHGSAYRQNEIIDIVKEMVGDNNV